MTNTIGILTLADLAIAFIPVAVVVALLLRWSLDVGHAIYAIGRMLLQLLLVGYFLAFIFGATSGWPILAILIIMVSASGWISLAMVSDRRRQLFTLALFAIALSGGATLLIVTQGVLNLDPWYAPRYMVPLAGMIFASAMNSVSLAAERFFAERERGVEYAVARNIAFRAALIPITNSLLAVGLVSLPGMMTGQILAGTSPAIAARYQIMVMCMIYGSTGISAGLFLALIRDAEIALMPAE
ncbi:MAG: ABC transporter permease [Candidatus Marinimicrobia bacterium]|nr:ABC transporter permease [Candidatus Neomarinimicrobiota bacterium]